MITSAKALALAIIAVTGAASIGMSLADWKLAAQEPSEVVKLERVVVVGKRSIDAPVVVAQLPRVVITGRSTAAAEVQVAAACTGQVLC